MKVTLTSFLCGSGRLWRSLDVWWRAARSCVMGPWLRSEKEAWGVHKSLQLHLLDQKHDGFWLRNKDIKINFKRSGDAKSPTRCHVCPVWFVQCKAKGAAQEWLYKSSYLWLWWYEWVESLDHNYIPLKHFTKQWRIIFSYRSASTSCCMIFIPKKLLMACLVSRNHKGRDHDSTVNVQKSVSCSWGTSIKYRMVTIPTLYLQTAMNHTHTKNHQILLCGRCKKYFRQARWYFAIAVACLLYKPLKIRFENKINSSFVI